MTLSEELQWRGFVQDSTYSDLSQLDNQTVTFYHGFDASAPSQTIGNLAAMMLDRAMIRHGHKAIILAGGATSLIGDPGGKDKERPMQTVETITANVEAAKVQLGKIFSGLDYTLVNNLDWTKDMTVLEFLRDIGKHYSMTPLVQRDYIAKRMGEGGEGISYTEFSYTLLQGMDYLYLFDNYGCTLQLGGSDQWGNCLSGVDLIRRARGSEVNVITNKLVINQATGKKFGKSEEGAVWLDPNLTSPYKFYQFWLNLDDEGVEYYLKIYTELDKETIDQLMEQHRAEPHLRKAQKRLAEEVTRLVHGQDNLATVQAVTGIIFAATETEVNEEIANSLKTELPVILKNRNQLNDIPGLLTELGLASSKSEARTFLDTGAIKAGLRAEKLNLDSDIARFEQYGFILLRRGRNNVAIVELT
ncbi:tyrosine--tRNA ligase [Candidatus Nomurabacteria bacterium]|nr:tyrosine--tRNA ligase [Candidatus Nomurabacteria bacterium]